MHTHDAIEQRRSVKHYDSSLEMPEEDLHKLLHLTLLSPTSFNIQNWRFVVCRDPAVKSALCAAAWNQSQVKDAQLAIVLCADLKAHDRDPARYWRNAPEATQNMLVPMIKQFYSENAQLARDEAMRSIGIAAQTIMLAAKAMGYDTCPMVGFDPAKVAEIIHLPQDHLVGMMVVVGRGAKPAYERGGQLPLEEVIFTDRFPA